MRLISLHARNFRAHRDSRISFPPRGVVALIGPNGSGKSTLATEGILFALYGSAAVRGTMPTVRWKGAHSRLHPEIELVVELDGEPLRIVRSDKDCHVYAGNIPVAAGTSAANGYLAGRLGLTLGQFLSSFVCQQKDLARLAALRPIERQIFVRDLVGISRIDRALEACRRRKNDLARERDGLAAGLGERDPLAADVVVAQQAVTHAKDAWRDASDTAAVRQIDDRDVKQALAGSTARKEAHDTAEQRRVQAEADATAARRDLDRIRAELDDAHRSRAQLTEQEALLEPLAALRAERDRLLAARAAASERRTLEQTIAAAKADVATYTGYLTECDAAIAAHDPAALAEVKENYRRTDARLRALRGEREQKLATARAEAASADAEAKRMLRRMDLLREQGPTGACPTCAQVLGARFDAVMAQLREDARRANATGVEAAALITALSEASDDELALEVELEEVKACGEELRRIEIAAAAAREKRPSWAHQIAQAQRRLEEATSRLAAIADVVFIPAALVQLEDEITRIERLDSGLAPLRAKAGRIQLLHEQRAAAEQRYADATSHVEQAETAIAAADFDPDDHASLLEQAAAAAAALGTAREQAARAHEQHRAAEEAFRKAMAALAAYDARAAQLDSLARAVRVHERAAERLDAFRVAAAGTLRPEMEEYVSGFVSVLTDGRHESVTITDDFAVLCQEGGVDMEVISGGTEDIVAIAQRVALSQMLAERRGAPLSLLILDEPFGGLDDVWRPGVLAFFRRLAETFPQLVLVSHIEETRTAADFIVEVVRDDAAGCSRVIAPSIETPAMPLLAAAGGA